MAGEAVDLHAAMVPLNPERPEQRRVGELDYLAGFELTSEMPDFGGWSGMSLEGDRLLLVSDLGLWIQLRLRQAKDGTLEGIGEALAGRLRDTSGDPLTARRLRDAEAVERDADGGLLVAFERDHRIWRYPGPLPEGRAAPVAAPQALSEQPYNGGIEAMALLAPGRLLLLSEGALNAAGDRRGWIGAGTAWDELSLATAGQFKPTGLSRLPGSSDTLLLERRFSWIGGLGVRLSLLPGADIQAGARLCPRLLAELLPPLTLDNFEAIAAAPAAGGTLIYLVSDDNLMRPLQRTLLLQFLLPHAALTTVRAETAEPPGADAC